MLDDQYITLLIESLSDPPSVEASLSLQAAIWRSQQLLGKEFSNVDTGALIIGLRKFCESIDASQGNCVICYKVGDEGLMCPDNHFTCQDCLQSWSHFNLEEKKIDILCPGYSCRKWCSHTYDPTSLLNHMSPILHESWQKLSLHIACNEEKVLCCNHCKYWELDHNNGLAQMGGFWECSKCQTVMCYVCDPPIQLGKKWDFYQRVGHGRDHIHHIPPEQHRNNISRIISSLEQPIMCPSCKIDTPQRENSNNMFQCPQCYFWYCFLCLKKLHRDETQSLTSFNYSNHHNPIQKCECLWDDKAKLHWIRLRVMEYVKYEAFDEKEVKSALVEMGLEPVDSKLCRVM